MSMKKPGRVELICIKCENKFKTHSTNREQCHKCLPKCTEKHYFNLPKAKVEKVEKIDKKAGKTDKKAEQEKVI